MNKLVEEIIGQVFLREEKLKLELIRNKILGGVLVLVIFVLIVFK